MRSRDRSILAASISALALAALVWSGFAAFDMDRAGLLAGLAVGLLAAVRLLVGNRPPLPEARVSLTTEPNAKTGVVQRLEIKIDRALWHQTA